MPTVYSGKGTYKKLNTTPVTYQIDYNIYLPAGIAYKFHTDKVYNVSAGTLSEAIMLFMELPDEAPDRDISATTATTTDVQAISIIVNPKDIIQLSGNIPITFLQDIKVYIRHDDALSTDDAKTDICGALGLASGIGKPKKHGFGTIQSA